VLPLLFAAGMVSCDTLDGWLNAGSDPAAAGRSGCPTDRKVPAMKLVTAILQPAKLEDVKAALAAANFTGLTIAEVKGHGAQKGRTEYYRGAEIQVEFLSKVRVDLIVDDKDVDSAIGIIVEAARTGNIGDGKVWASDVTHLVRVRTGETGPEAL
jgi:nitrogen regulatory protein PII